jgi:hypothetical protein
MPVPAVAVKGELAPLVARPRPLTASSARGGWLVMTRSWNSACHGTRAPHPHRSSVVVQRVVAGARLDPWPESRLVGITGDLFWARVCALLGASSLGRTAAQSP